MAEENTRHEVGTVQREWVKRCLSAASSFPLTTLPPAPYAPTTATTASASQPLTRHREHKSADEMKKEILDAFQQVFGDEMMAALRLLFPEKLEERIVQFASDNPYINHRMQELLEALEQRRTQPYKPQPPRYIRPQSPLGTHTWRTTQHHG